MTALEKYGRDMTAAAASADPVIGRDDEIDRVVCTLCRRTKNSAVLVGEPGVGKTAIAEGLAQRIAAGAVPSAIAGARVVEIDIGAMIAGTGYRGMFEERMNGVIREAEDGGGGGGKVILFIDEMHMLLGAGLVEGSNMDAANMLKPALARGRIRCLGATTFDEYRKYIEKDAAFERRLQKVLVEEPSPKATIGILRGLKQRYEEHHGLTILDDGLLTDGKGRAVDFKNTIIILTSNLGAEHLAEAMAGNRTVEAARDLVRAKVQQHFKPEFLNRLSEIVIFEPLSHDKLKEVVKIQMKGIIAATADKGISLSTSDDALDVILSESYKPMYGARPISRWVQKNVMTKLSDMLIKGEVDAGSTISIEVEAIDDKKALKYEVTKKLELQQVVASGGERIVVEVLSDNEDDDDDDVVEVVAPVAKKSKVTKSSAAPKS
ncbi:unnamed protein product [Urochloa humidicola]